MFLKLRNKLQKRVKLLFKKNKRDFELVPPAQIRASLLSGFDSPKTELTLSLANRIPHDVLDMIFEEATFVPGALETFTFVPKFSKENEYHRLKESRAAARSLTLVCSRWYYAGRPYLYRVVVLDGAESVRLLASAVRGGEGGDPSHDDLSTRRLDLYLESSEELFDSLAAILLRMPKLVIFRWRHPIGAAPLSYEESVTRPHNILHLLKFLEGDSLKVLNCVDGLPRLSTRETRDILKSWPHLETLSMSIWGGGADGTYLVLPRLRSVDISRMLEIPFRPAETMASLAQVVDTVGGWDATGPLTFGYERFRQWFCHQFNRLDSFVLKVDPGANPYSIRHYVENVTRQLSDLVNFTLILDDWDQLPKDLCVYNAAFLGLGLQDPRLPRHAPQSDRDQHYRHFFETLSGIVVHPEFQAVYFLDDALYHHSEWQKHKSWHSVARLLINFQWEILARDSTTLVPFPPDLPELPSTSVRIKRTITMRQSLPAPWTWIDELVDGETF
ncbi:hypothetical protein OE88DRAFT_1729629 [Heliocybe sulcata]|uniref:Uncharacterized protein n=1 Tax=Heliocybe sulcata TaxID=5364 RepID=A0A5C3MJQ2_9AGAM|nr:hypothetical protein OE88DRAFT_1729629 [Heliocybe sulcata]